jgi:osmotically-inducible protein OsmY
MITWALVRNAQLDARNIQVTVAGTAITLEGTVRSAAERIQAAQAAWASPHVTHVENRITVRQP